MPLYFDKYETVNTLLALTAFYLLLKMDYKEAFWSGFFIGIFWFYWIALSFRYYDLSWLIPAVIVIISMGYAIVFFAGYYLIERFFKGCLFAKALFLWLLSYIHPFGFNWFIPDILLLDTIFYPDKLSFFIFLMLLALTIRVPKRYKIISLSLLLLLSLYNPSTKIEPAPLDIYIATTHIPQDKKWQLRYRDKIIEDNFALIQKAIEKRADVVVLPESTFPLFLNQEPYLIKRLKTLSQKIAIVTGGLYVKGDKYFNSTYLFTNKEMKVFHKAVLVPFGEEIPLPKWMAKWVNRVFFGGSSDYTPSQKAASYTIKGVKFTNAICYEATHPMIYDQSPRYIIAMSNNAWFIPSIEPKLQHKIIKYYAKIYKKVVYHSTNIAISGVIR